ncbi:DUF6053 domain-containing protein [Lysobacter capsici]|uniref:DUF6053 domain-containing protein n=1 Tax=Lysobacter capsici TaxID=435897 RepID=UPI003D2F8737
MGGAAAPTPCVQITATRPKGVGAQAPPTKAPEAARIHPVRSRRQARGCHRNPTR